MADDERKAAAEQFAALDPDEQRQAEPPKEKLPHARYYLRAARWGFEAMVKNRQMGAGFMFHLVAVASVARAVPEVLITTDRKLSDAHRAVIGEWSQRTRPASTPVIHFLKTIRDLLLHDGTLQAYATASGTGHRDEVVIETEAYYSVARYDEQGQRHDLLAELRWALDWLKAELAEIEAKLPPRE
jgi:hypothetical protein